MSKKIIMLLIGCLIVWMGYGLFQTSSPSDVIIMLIIFTIWWVVVWIQFASPSKEREAEAQEYWSLVEIMKSKGYTRRDAIKFIDQLVKKGIPRDEIIITIHSC